MITDFMSIGLWAQVAMLDIYCIYWTVWDRFMQVMYLGRAPRTKETLPDFIKWRRVTRPPLVFRGLTDSQRTPGFWGVTKTHVPFDSKESISSFIASFQKDESLEAKASLYVLGVISSSTFNKIEILLSTLLFLSPSTRRQ